MTSQVAARSFQYTANPVTHVSGILKIINKNKKEKIYTITPLLNQKDVIKVSAFYASFNPINLSTGQPYSVVEIIRRVTSWKDKHWEGIPWSGYVICTERGTIVGLWDLELESSENVVLLSAKIRKDLLEQMSIAAWGWTTSALIPRVSNPRPSAVHVYMRPDHPFVTNKMFHHSGWHRKETATFSLNSRILYEYLLKP